MKQYKRGIQAYKNVSTGSLTKTEPIENDSFIKKTVNQQNTANEPEIENKYIHVAKLLMVLGSEEASKVISHLPPKDIENISKEIIKIDRVGKSEAYKILKEFGKDINSYSRNQGGVETARSILVTAFGQEKGNKLLYSAVPDSADKPFAFLNDLDFTQRMLVLRKESISVLTIILRYLSPKYASEILESLPPEQQKEIAIRISKLQRVSPEVIGIISENLTNKIKKLGTSESMEVDGRGALADILKHMDKDSENNILFGIDQKDPFLGEVIRDRLNTIDIIYNIDTKDFQEIIREISERDLVYLIKGESKAIQSRIWGAMSEGRKALVEEEMEIVGLVRKIDADRMTKEFIELIHKKEEEGVIRISTDDDWVY